MPCTENYMDFYRAGTPRLGNETRSNDRWKWPKNTGPRLDLDIDACVMRARTANRKAVCLYLRILQQYKGV